MRDTLSWSLLLLCLCSTVLGQSVDLLESAGLFSEKAQTLVTGNNLTASETFPRASSPGVLVKSVKQRVIVPSSDANRIFSIIADSDAEFSVSTLLRANDGWYAGVANPPLDKWQPMILFEIKSDTTTYLKIELRHRRSASGGSSAADITLWAVWQPDDGTTTPKSQQLAKEADLNSKIGNQQWIYMFIVFGKLSVGRDTSVVERKIDVYLDCSLVMRYQVGTDPIKEPPSGSTVSICGFGNTACRNLKLQDFYFSQRGFLYSLSRKYCPESTCKVDCNEDGLLLLQETAVAEENNINLANKLVDCQDEHSPSTPQYCIAADGSHIPVGTQVMESNTLTCKCLAHFRLNCTSTTVKPDCSQYENKKEIIPEGYTHRVCEAEYCPGGTEYRTEGIVCAKAMTCENRRGEGCSPHTGAGCYCPDGQIYDNDQTRNCVLSLHCPCTHKGKEIKHSSMKEVDNQLCVCKSGKVTCFSNVIG